MLASNEASLEGFDDVYFFYNNTVGQDVACTVTHGIREALNGNATLTAGPLPINITLGSPGNCVVFLLDGNIHDETSDNCDYIEWSGDDGLPPVYDISVYNLAVQRCTHIFQNDCAPPIQTYVQTYDNAHWWIIGWLAIFPVAFGSCLAVCACLLSLTSRRRR